MDGLTLPVAEYEHPSSPENRSVVGGVVYRGPDPEIHGLYLYADSYTREIFGLRRNNGVWESQVLQVQNVPGSGTFVSFGEDEAGNVYIADLDGRVFEVMGGRIGVANGWTRGPEAHVDRRWDPSEVGGVVHDLLVKAPAPEPVFRPR